MENNKHISLQGGEFYLSENSKTAYRVIKGTVIIYVVPINKGEAGRRSYLYEAGEGEMIPGFRYRDENYKNWCFCFVALEKAEFEIIENGCTSILYAKFAKKAKVKNYQTEGYEGGIVDQYRINIVTEDSFIIRTQKQKIKTSEKNARLIIDSFNKNGIVEESEKTNSRLYNAVEYICRKNKIKIVPFEKLTETCGDSFDVSDIARLSNCSYRQIILEDGWHKEDAGDFLVFDKDKKPLVCIGKGSRAYKLIDPETRSSKTVSTEIAHTLSSQAYMFYRPLPNKNITFKDILTFCTYSIRLSDIIWLILLTLATAGMGLITPIISQKIYDTYIPLGSTSVLFQIGCMLGTFMLANILFSIVKNVISFRITSRMGYEMQAAVYGKVFNLPESFFRDYESADLAQRIMGVGNMVNTIASTAFIGVISFVYIVIYFIKMIGYSSKLSLLGLVMIVIYSAVYFIISLRVIKYESKTVGMEGKTSSTMYQLLNGISKIRIAGVEESAIYEYLRPYISLRNTEARKNAVEYLGSVITAVSSTVFSVILYISIINSSDGISLGSFIAFTSIFGAFTASSKQIIESIINIKRQQPNIDRVKPVFLSLPEVDDAKELPGDISGAIEINGVSFAYDENSPNVIDNLSLNIKPGEYIGLVGSSGCGKSTLLKLLLGFEKPTSGKIYYDNNDIDSLDKRELRKKMGVVLQDGKLISGSIFENITITAPKAKLKDVKQVVKSVGLEDDINNMPMGLHTVLSEDCGTISGGQQQRILIARAIINSPKILFFDEATSALDNVTQNMICETLEAMDSTRIVIAHRLSTVIKCDRIIVMDKGNIVEQGTYDQLMEMKGLFYELASRQIA